MRVIELPTVWTLLIDIAAWLILHVATAYITFKMPDRFFDKDIGFYRTRPWEKGGQFWQNVFRVRIWKKWLPDGASIAGHGFIKKRLLSANSAGLEKYILESRRAELTHVLAMIPALLFFLWNPWVAGLAMICYAILINGPCLIAQRYNRPRFQNVLIKKQAKYIKEREQK
jgi:glycosyl-4,4'-diaponeurosporenoate acyltransferase